MLDGLSRLDRDHVGAVDKRQGELGVLLRGVVQASSEPILEEIRLVDTGEMTYGSQRRELAEKVNAS